MAGGRVRELQVHAHLVVQRLGAVGGARSRLEGEDSLAHLFADRGHHRDGDGRLPWGHGCDARSSWTAAPGARDLAGSMNR